MQPSSASIEHAVVRQWSFRARLTVLPPGWAPKPDGSAGDGSRRSEGLRSGSAATRAAAAAGAQVFSAKNAAGAAAGGALQRQCRAARVCVEGPPAPSTRKLLAAVAAGIAVLARL